MRTLPLVGSVLLPISIHSTGKLIDPSFWFHELSAEKSSASVSLIAAGRVMLLEPGT